MRMLLRGAFLRLFEGAVARPHQEQAACILACFRLVSGAHDETSSRLWMASV